MATFTKRGKSWHVQVSRNGTRKTASFSTKAEATAWATKTDSDILAGKRALPDKPFSDLLDKYADEVSPKKGGARWERIRLAAIGKMDIGKIRLPELNATHFANWRDDRLKVVTGATVNRDWNLLSNCCSVARDEWHWLSDNPMSKVKRPKDSLPRDKLIDDRDIERAILACGYDYSGTPGTITARIGAAFLFAIETAMRAGEIAGLEWEHIDLETRVAKLLKTKNGDKRDVPLSTEAIRILKQLPKSPDVFNLTAEQISSNFRGAKEASLISEFTFHDTRHLAITRLSEKLDIRELARMTGHRDLRKLMVYYNKPASETAKKLD